MNAPGQAARRRTAFCLRSAVARGRQGLVSRLRLRLRPRRRRTAKYCLLPLRPPSRFTGRHARLYCRFASPIVGVPPQALPGRYPSRSGALGGSDRSSTVLNGFPQLFRAAPVERPGRIGDRGARSQRVFGHGYRKWMGRWVGIRIMTKAARPNRSPDVLA